MVSDSEKEEILEAAVAGVPRVAQGIAAIPASTRLILEAAEQSNLKRCRI